MKIIVATTNQGKIREVRQIMDGLGYEILTMKEAGVEIEVDETGTTFLENAFLKAEAIHKLTGELVLADDSGLEIDYFDKAPGVYSSRYLGVDTPYEEKNRIILEKLKDVEDEKRSARYVCAIAGILPDGTKLHSIETVEGFIAHEAKGNGGFGYDPIFFVPFYQKTMAELLPEEKNAISHRGKH
ncbi:Nucleoside 5-triphosphatase RdgB (dHAPTP, dITP, XTP-specific) [Lachnospiraceae bacterium TWA4]|nr:Nucleoside 5-triphosphatase RdgB (dHAPTP, dITP, XTP-specific) [Lachnospiraceae bacterium TWA4]